MQWKGRYPHRRIWIHDAWNGHCLSDGTVNRSDPVPKLLPCWHIRAISMGCLRRPAGHHARTKGSDEPAAGQRLQVCERARCGGHVLSTEVLGTILQRLDNTIDAFQVAGHCIDSLLLFLLLEYDVQHVPHLKCKLGTVRPTWPG
eukprot:scaffold3759_cov425-Prasinococcus_capsulatus_cf.AAC.9